jgi:hypothetical protein
VIALTTSPNNASFQADNSLDIISKLCSVIDDTAKTAAPDESSPTTPAPLAGYSLLATLSSLLLTISEKGPAHNIFDDPTLSDEEFNAICDILDQQNLLDDGIDIKGYYNISDPFAFAAGTQNNPDLLS